MEYYNQIEAISDLDNIFNEEDKFMIIASDGVWEYLSNDSVMEILAKDYEAGLSAIEAADIVIMDDNIKSNF